MGGRVGPSAGRGRGQAESATRGLVMVRRARHKRPASQEVLAGIERLTCGRWRRAQHAVGLAALPVALAGALMPVSAGALTFRSSSSSQTATARPDVVVIL